MVTHTVPMSDVDAEQAPSLRNSSVSRKSLVGRVNADFMTQKKSERLVFFSRTAHLECRNWPGETFTSSRRSDYLGFSSLGRAASAFGAGAAFGAASRLGAA